MAGVASFPACAIKCDLSRNKLLNRKCHVFIKVAFNLISLDYDESIGDVLVQSLKWEQIISIWTFVLIPYYSGSHYLKRHTFFLHWLKIVCINNLKITSSNQNKATDPKTPSLPAICGPSKAMANKQT